MEMQADARKKRYITKLKRLYRDIPEDARKKAEALIERLADILLMMDECREHIAEEGCVSEMPQGKYSIMRENPYSRVYDAKHKLMLSTMDKLEKLRGTDGEVNDELMAFLGDRMGK